MALCQLLVRGLALLQRLPESTGDGEVGKRLRLEPAIPHIVPLSLDDHHLCRTAKTFIALRQLGGICFERDDPVAIAMDVEDRDFCLSEAAEPVDRVVALQLILQLLLAQLVSTAGAGEPRITGEVADRIDPDNPSYQLRILVRRFEVWFGLAEPHRPIAVDVVDEFSLRLFVSQISHEIPFGSIRPPRSREAVR